MSSSQVVTSLKETYPWINNDLIKSAVEKATSRRDVNVKNFSLESALPVGENFSSQMLRCKITYDEDCEMRFILKIGLNKSELSEIIDEIDAFGTESTVFTEIMPKVQKMLEDVGEEISFSANLHGFSASPQCLLLEDLSVDGYKNRKKILGLDMEHMKAVLVKVAKYHAATATLSRIDQSAIKRLRGKIVTEERTFYNVFFDKTINTALEAINTWPGFESIAKKLKALIPNLMPLCIHKVFERDEEGFNVLLHADLWTNNIMYQYDENNCIKNVKMVDFQGSCWASPGIDLSYLIFSSSDVNITGDKIDELLQLYHTNLDETLRKLNYPGKIPTLIELHNEFLSRSAYAVSICMIIVGIRTPVELPPDMSAFMNEKEGSAEFRRSLMLSKEFRDYMQPLLKYMDRKGILDQKL